MHAIGFCHSSNPLEIKNKYQRLGTSRFFFKKGDASELSNYRPISLVNTGYKLFAIVLLNRLKGAGVESLICRSQFGFRSGGSTSDALFLARRFKDKAIAQRDGKLVMLALNWAKHSIAFLPQR